MFRRGLASVDVDRLQFARWVNPASAIGEKHAGTQRHDLANLRTVVFVPEARPRAHVGVLVVDVHGYASHNETENK